MVASLRIMALLLPPSFHRLLLLPPFQLPPHPLHHRCLRSLSHAISPPAQPPPPPPADAVPLLEKLRSRQLKDRVKPPSGPSQPSPRHTKKSQAAPVQQPVLASSFRELRLSEQLLAAVQELNLSKPTEVQCLGIPAILAGENVVLASHTGSGKTLAYMFPLVQCLKRDEAETAKATRPRRPRAVVLCPTRELAEQVFRVAKSLSHHARFRSAMIGGGCRMRPQEDALNSPVDVLVGTPGRLLMHVSEGNMSYGDIKYVVLDEADTMFDRGFGPEVRKFLGPLRNRSSKPGDEGFQTILVTATITKAVQGLLDEEFPGIRHLHTSTLHKKIPNARHGFIKLSGTENKLESLLQVLEPSIAKGERVMVFCNTLNSCRAVDHFLNENNIRTVNYHGDVPAEERVEGLNKFKSENGDYPVLVCTDLAARGLDLVVDHVIMFDFPLNPIDYLHRTGRTARMGAKGKVTSLVTKRNLTLAGQVEEAIQNGESLEALTASREKLEATKKLALKLQQQEKSKAGKFDIKAKLDKRLKTGTSGVKMQQKRKIGKPVIKVKRTEKPKIGMSNTKQGRPITRGVRVQKSPLKKLSGVQFFKGSKSGSKNLGKDRSKKVSIRA